MADAHGQKSSKPGAHGHDDHDDHDTHGAHEEEALRTPAWLPFVGLALLLLGSAVSYRFLFSGAAQTSTTQDGGTEGGAAAEPTPAPSPAPQPPH